MIGLREDEAGKPEHHAGDRCLAQQQRFRGQRTTDAGNIVDVIGAVMDAPHMAGPVTDDTGDQAWHQRRIFDATDREHFQREHGAGERRAEHRPEAGGNTGHQQNADAGWIEPDQTRDRTREASPELHGCPLAPCGAAEQVRRHGSDEDQWRHAQRHAATGLVDLLDDQVVAAFDAPARPLVEQPDREAARRQQEQQPGMREARPCRDVETPQEGSAETSDRQRHRHENQSPAKHRDGVAVARADERSDV